MGGGGRGFILFCIFVIPKGGGHIFSHICHTVILSYLTYTTYCTYFAYIVSCCYVYLIIPVQDMSYLTTRMTAFNHHKMKEHVTKFSHREPCYKRIPLFPFVEKTLRRSNRQDMVFIRPPGISEGAFELRMGNIWFCKLLLLFKIRSRTDTELKDLDCAYVSVLEEYNRRRITSSWVATGTRRSVRVLGIAGHRPRC